jgi:signal peptidase I
MVQNNFIKILKKTWHFIWEDDSALSWIVNIILAIILIKFIVYPGLGLAFGTNYPIVAVVSDSMEHKMSFDRWWSMQGNFYDGKNITMQEFRAMPFRNGFNKGDLMVLLGAPPSKVKLGDVIVFMAGKPDPIIHRVVEIKNSEGAHIYETKGDHNQNQIVTSWLDETNVNEKAVVGRAVLRIPYLGWVKIAAVDFVVSVVNFLR